MLLIVSNSQDFTANFLQEKISESGLPFARFDTDTFPKSISISSRINGMALENNLVLPSGKKISIEDVSAIWWRRPERIGEKTLGGFKDERIKKFTRYQLESSFDELTAILDRRVLWVNHPEQNRHANSKLVQLRLAVQLGFKIPDTVFSNNPQEVKSFFDCHGGQVVHKAIRRPAFLFGNKMVGFYTSRVNADDISEEESIRVAPVLLQEIVEKKLELRITVVGQRVVTASIASQSSPKGALDWRRIPTEAEQWKPFDLDPATERKCRELTHALNLNFGAIDLALTPKDEIVFFEINPNGQWAWLEIGSGIMISKFFTELFS